MLEGGDSVGKVALERSLLACSTVNCRKGGEIEKVGHAHVQKVRERTIPERLAILASHIHPIKLCGTKTVMPIKNLAWLNRHSP